MKKTSKSKKSSNLADYIYIRIGEDTKNAIKQLADADGMNMTTWVRRELKGIVRRRIES